MTQASSDPNASFLQSSFLGSKNKNKEQKKNCTMVQERQTIKQSYTATTPMDYNGFQHGKIFIKVQEMTITC